jgi:hypothetical protein
MGAERRRLLVIVLFVVGSIALAVVLAFLYSVPPAGSGY